MASPSTEGNLLGPPANSGKTKPSSSDEKAPDSSDNTTSPRGVGWPKGKKRKKVAKDSADPHKPLSAYLWFSKEQREKIRLDNPTWSFTDITRKCGQDWRALTTEQKQQYVDAAEEDRGRYAKEVADYKKSDAYRNFAGRENKRIKEELAADEASSFDIPIFTEEFLDHNKVREAELRQLRKSNADFEQQNAILEKMVENTRTATTKLEEETLQQRCHNQALLQHLEQMRNTLVDAFGEMPLPGESSGPTLQTIDAYMKQLLEILQIESPSSAMYTRVRDVVRRLDLHG